MGGANDDDEEEARERRRRAREERKKMRELEDSGSSEVSNTTNRYHVLLHECRSDRGKQRLSSHGTQQRRYSVTFVWIVSWVDLQNAVLSHRLSPGIQQTYGADQATKC